MKEPCKSCPFRVENGIALSENRVKEILYAITHDGSFSCHKTVDYSLERPLLTKESKLCFGSVLFLENAVQGGCRSNVMYRLGLRLNNFELSDLRKDPCVFQSEQDFLDAGI